MAPTKEGCKMKGNGPDKLLERGAKALDEYAKLYAKREEIIARMNKLRAEINELLYERQRLLCKGQASEIAEINPAAWSALTARTKE
jgi:hypothetical protein